MFPFMSLERKYEPMLNIRPRTISHVFTENKEEASEKRLSAQDEIRLCSMNSSHLRKPHAHHSRVIKLSVLNNTRAAAVSAADCVSVNPALVNSLFTSAAAEAG